MKNAPPVFTMEMRRSYGQVLHVICATETSALRAMLDIRWLCSVTSWPPPIPASPLFPPVLDVVPSDWPTIIWLSSLSCLSWKKGTAYSVQAEGVPAWDWTLAGQRGTDFQIRFRPGVRKNYFSSKVRRWLAGSRLPGISSRWGVRTVAIGVVIFLVCIIWWHLFGRYHELVFWLKSLLNA
jgi:hypothetical protein